MQTTEYFQIDFRTFVQTTSQKATKKNDEESLARTGSGDKTLGYKTREKNSETYKPDKLVDDELKIPMIFKL